MDEKKPKKNKIKYLFYLLIIIFTFLYVSGKTGYYESKLSTSSKLTKEAILEFENDIKEGKAVDIKNYINPKNVNYKNKYSNLGYNISNLIDKGLNDGVGYLLKLLKALFN